MSYHEELLPTADEITSEAQRLFMKDGFVIPVLFMIMNDGSISNVSVRMSCGEDKEILSMLLQHLASKSDIAGIYFLNEASVSDTKDLLNPQDALVGLLFTREATSMRIIQYARNDASGIPLFADRGWSQTEATQGLLSNPFISKGLPEEEEINSESQK